MDWIVFTAAQRVEAMDHNSGQDFWIIPRLIDNPGNPRHGNYVAPARVVEGDYAPFWAGRLAGHDRIEADPGELFLSPIEYEV